MTDKELLEQFETQTGEVGVLAFQPRADLQNQAIGWLQREYSSLDGGAGV